MVNVQLPDGASLERTDAVMKKLEEIARDEPGVGDVLNFAGYSVVSQYGTNTGSMVLVLKPW
jgi:multidrug efflux pump subunit AcrB